jgi:hypothetical protein
VSFIVFAFLARKPLCIDSKLVERIDRIGAQATSSIYRCSLRKAVPYEEKWAQSQGDFSRRIQRVEKFLESLSPYEERVRITILENRPSTYKVLNHDIYLGEDLASSPGALEKGLLKIWFREKANSLILDHPLLEESFTDLLSYAINGQIEIYDPLMSQNLELRDPKWPFVVMTLPSYCKSPWRQTEHFQFCLNMKAPSGSSAKSLVLPSLRPLLSEVLIESYLGLSLGARKSLLENIPEFLQSLDFEDSGVGFTSLKEDQQSLVDLSAELSGLIKNMEMHAAPAHLAKWVGLVKQNLEQRGFSEEPLVAQADLLVVLKGLKGSEIFSSESWRPPPGKTILGYDQENLFLLPNVEGLDRNMLGRVYTQKVLYLHCGSLLVSDLEAFFEKTTRLLAVQLCDSKQGIKLDAYLSGNIDKFASQNPDLKFMYIHIPSLALALKMKKIDSHERLSLAELSKDVIQKKLGWKSSVFDERLKIYRVQGDIEAIRSYRP